MQHEWFTLTPVDRQLMEIVIAMDEQGQATVTLPDPFGFRPGAVFEIGSQAGGDVKRYVCVVRNGDSGSRYHAWELEQTAR